MLHRYRRPGREQRVGHVNGKVVHLTHFRVKSVHWSGIPTMVQNDIVLPVVEMAFDKFRLRSTNQMHDLYKFSFWFSFFRPQSSFLKIIN
jgi:hypothetical protein